MATLDFQTPHTTESEPELHLLLPKEEEQSLWQSLVGNFKETFFPKKLPPLVLTSKPIPVKDIWGFYNYRKSATTLSTIAHIVVLTIVIVATIYLGRRVVQQQVKPTVSIVAPDLNPPIMKPAKTE